MIEIYFTTKTLKRLSEIELCGLYSQTFNQTDIDIKGNSFELQTSIYNYYRKDLRTPYTLRHLYRIKSMNEIEAIRTMTQSINFVDFLRCCHVQSRYVHIRRLMSATATHSHLIYCLQFSKVIRTKAMAEKQFKWTVSETAVDHSHGHDSKRETGGRTFKGKSMTQLKGNN